jgi:hypothetical protein
MAIEAHRDAVAALVAQGATDRVFIAARQRYLASRQAATRNAVESGRFVGG